MLLGLSKMFKRHNCWKKNWNIQV